MTSRPPAASQRGTLPTTPHNTTQLSPEPRWRGLIVVTHNTRKFRRTRVNCIDPGRTPDGICGIGRAAGKRATMVFTNRPPGTAGPSLGTDRSEGVGAFTWKIADKLRGYLKPHEHVSVMPPTLVLFRLDPVLEPTKLAVLAHEVGPDLNSPVVDALLKRAAGGLPFYSTCTRESLPFKAYEHSLKAEQEKRNALVLDVANSVGSPSKLDA